MVGGIFYEHGHRMIASMVGMLTIALVVWTWRVDPRRWIRWLSAAALGAVILQGLLGGITVLFLLPAPVSIGHAALAQLFFCITVSMALFTSRGWRNPSVEPPDDAKLKRIALATTVFVYVQILIGATMRHRGAGLAIPDFPLAFGRLLPPFWTVDIALHFAHRVGAICVVAMIVAAASYIGRHHRRSPALARPAWLMLLLVGIQVTLGALVVLDGSPANRQHRAPRQWGAAAGDVSGSHLAHSLDAAGNGHSHQPGRRFATITTDRSTLVKTNAAALPADRTKMSDYVMLAKPRLNGLVVASALAGYAMAGGDTSDVVRVCATLLGTALVASGASAFNQLLERDSDALMRRTRLRPLPDGRLQPSEALVFAAALSALGFVVLALAVNLLSAAVALATLASYALVYTPLKRRTSFATVIGAIPGALPPVIGWAAGRGDLSQGAWVLFAILFLWQLPHFLAIAWIYREDYARAGLRMLPVLEPDGRSTARQAIVYSAALLPVAMAPTLLGMTGTVYFAGAFVLTAALLVLAVYFAKDRVTQSARWLFYGSIIYLPLLWILMIADRH